MFRPPRSEVGSVRQAATYRTPRATVGSVEVVGNRERNPRTERDDPVQLPAVEDFTEPSRCTPQGRQVVCEVGNEVVPHVKCRETTVTTPAKRIHCPGSLPEIQVKGLGVVIDGFSKGVGCLNLDTRREAPLDARQKRVIRGVAVRHQKLVVR